LRLHADLLVTILIRYAMILLESLSVKITDSRERHSARFI